MRYGQYPVRPRAEVEALCPTPTIARYDGRLDTTPHNPHSSVRLVTSEYTGTRQVTEAQNQKRKTKEHNAIERSFRADTRAHGLGPVAYFTRNKAIKRYTGSGK